LLQRTDLGTGRCLSCGPKLFGELREHLYGQLRYVPQKNVEDSGPENGHLRLCGGDDGGRSRRRVEQRELTEVVARAQVADGVAAAVHAGCAVEEHVEGVARFSFDDEFDARSGSGHQEVPGDGSKLASVTTAEQVDAAQLVCELCSAAHVDPSDFASSVSDRDDLALTIVDAIGVPHLPRSRHYQGFLDDSRRQRVASVTS